MRFEREERREEKKDTVASTFPIFCNMLVFAKVRVNPTAPHCAFEFTFVVCLTDVDLFIFLGSINLLLLLLLCLSPSLVICGWCFFHFFFFCLTSFFLSPFWNTFCWRNHNHLWRVGRKTEERRKRRKSGGG